jgi:hypothetical protein
MGWLTGYSTCAQVAIPGSSIGTGGVSNYAAYMPLSQIPSYVRDACTDQTNFTDLRVTLDDGTTVLNLDRSGAVGELHFGVPAWLSSATNYARWYSGNAGIGNMSTAEQQAVWTAAGYSAVWHCNEPSGNLVDATGNGYTMVPTGSPTYNQTGLLGPCISLPGSDANYFSTSSTPITDPPLTMTVLALPSASSTTYRTLVELDDGSGWNNVAIRLHRVSSTFYVNPNQTIEGNGGGGNLSSFSTSSWNYIALQVYVSGGNTFLKCFKNGIQIGAPSLNGVLSGLAKALIGYDVSSGYPYWGLIQEVRLTTALLSAAWQLTEFNNQSSPATFYGAWTQMFPPASFFGFHGRNPLGRLGPSLKGCS